MGRKHDEIWQELCDLDNRVTRLEELIADDNVEMPDSAPVDDAADLRAENARLLAERDEVDALVNQLRGAMAAQDSRERAAGEKCGVLYEHNGCDWPDGVADYVLLLRGQWQEAAKERDALRARIEAGRVMYGGMYGHQNKIEMWTFEHVDTDTMTARLIDIAPIADHIADAGDVDERKGERRVPDEFNEKAWDSSMRVREGRRFSNTNDRRRTTGTRADRKAGSNE